MPTLPADAPIHEIEIGPARHVQQTIARNISQRRNPPPPSPRAAACHERPLATPHHPIMHHPHPPNIESQGVLRDLAGITRLNQPIGNRLSSIISTALRGSRLSRGQVRSDCLQPGITHILYLLVIRAIIVMLVAAHQQGANRQAVYLQQSLFRTFKLMFKGKRIMRNVPG